MQQIGLDLKIYSFAVTRPWLCEEGRLVGIFSYLVKVSFVPKTLLLDISFVTGKKPLSATIVIIGRDKALVN